MAVFDLIEPPNLSNGISAAEQKNKAKYAGRSPGVPLCTGSLPAVFILLRSGPAQWPGCMPGEALTDADGAGGVEHNSRGSLWAFSPCRELAAVVYWSTL